MPSGIFCICTILSLIVNIFLNKQFGLFLLVFILLNIFLYLFITAFHSKIGFNSYNYIYNSHHFFEDGRIKNEKNFNLLRALGQYDAQWYLKIASTGYPKYPQVSKIDDKSTMNGLTYAFFPLYPMILRLVDYLISNIELSAFLVSNILLIVNFASLYFVVGKLFDKNLGLKTAFLIFLFPFSIFFRSYFTEGLQLLLLVWFGYFFVKKNFLISAVFLSLINISKGNLLLLNLVFLILLFRAAFDRKLSVIRLAGLALIIFTPLLGWTVFNFLQTGNYLYFYSVQKSWFDCGFIFCAPLNNLYVITYFLQLPFHYFHASKIDVFIVFIALVTLIKSRNFLPREWWWMSFAIFITPLLVKDLLSYTRLQMISFPLFLYIASSVNKVSFTILIVVLFAALFFTSLFFVNWYWVG